MYACIDASLASDDFGWNERMAGRNEGRVGTATREAELLLLQRVFNVKRTWFKY